MIQEGSTVKIKRGKQRGFLGRVTQVLAPGYGVSEQRYGVEVRRPGRPAVRVSLAASSVERVR